MILIFRKSSPEKKRRRRKKDAGEEDDPYDFDSAEEDVPESELDGLIKRHLFF